MTASTRALIGRTHDALGNLMPHIDGSELRHNYKAVAYLIGRRNTHFPEAHFVTFTRPNLNAKLKSDFLACSETDGVRHLLYLGTDQSKQRRQFLIDRKNQYYGIPESFSTASDTGTEQLSEHDLYRGTLLDGEHVRQKTAGGQPKLFYLISDRLAISGDRVMDRAYDARIGSLKICSEAVCGLSALIPTRPQLWSLGLLLKTFQPLQSLETLLQHSISDLPFVNDGLIFTSKYTPYTSGTGHNVLEWKRLEDFTVDFLVQPWLVTGKRIVCKRKTRVENGRKFYLFAYFDDTGHQCFAPVSVAASECDCIERESREFESTIKECFNDKRTGLWRPKLRSDDSLVSRRDKARANHISVVEDILRALRDNIMQQDHRSCTRE